MMNQNRQLFKAVALGFLTVLLLLILLPLPPANSEANREDKVALPGEWVWMNWQAAQFALAEDSQSVWIAATGSVLQWHKETGISQRYGPTDGLFHRQMLAVAVDAAGNRWFGGDAGLSRFDPEGVWTHYTSENSGLPLDFVDSIAVSENGTLWLSHGLPDGSISQWDPDDTWHFHPNRTAAVMLAYNEVQETINTNDLWAVAGDEVWVDYDVYDGLTWENRRPPEGSDFPLAVRANNNDGIWVLDESTVYAWDGNNWLSYIIEFWFDGSANALTIGPDDTVWVGWQERFSSPYVNRTAGITLLPEKPGVVPLEQSLDVPGPVVELLATTEGLWGIGPAWLLPPNQPVLYIEEAPRYQNVTEVIRTTTNMLFVHSQYLAPYSWGAIQTLADQGTTMLSDDVWQSSIAFPILTAAETLPDGGLWVAGYDQSRVITPTGPLRYHQGEWLEYDLPFFIYDIFAESERYTWFAYDSGNERGVMQFDDGNTPADYADDIWTNYPIDSDGIPAAVAVDALGRLWYGDTTGLYHHTNMAWQPNNLEQPVCDMVPAADGTLFIQRANDCSDLLDESFNIILIIRPDGEQETKHIAMLVEEEFERVRSASRRNQLWTIAPDGAIWYLRRHSQLRVERYDGMNLAYDNLPFNEEQYSGGTIEIDENNFLWLTGDSQLWRLSPLPDFWLEEQVWLLSPGSSRQRSFSVHGIGGYSESVSLEMIELPAGISATFESNPVIAGQTTRVTLTVNEAVTLGTYNATLQGSDGIITHTVPLTLMVVPTVYDVYLPLAIKP